MAYIKYTFTTDNKRLSQIAGVLPSVSGKFLAYVGGKARHLLKKLFLSGQEIDLRAYPKDKKGRYTITSNVSKDRKSTTIKSYPLNLFEEGRYLRNGEREPGKFVLQVKLKEAVMSNLPQYANDFEKEPLEEVLKNELQ